MQACLERLRNGSKYMYVEYSCDDASCAGFHFTIYSETYNSLDELWEKCSDDVKGMLIKSNLKI